MKVAIIFEESDFPLHENKIDRIKKIRQSLGVGLKEAKDLHDGQPLPLPNRDIISMTTKVESLLGISQNELNTAKELVKEMYKR